jgi:hypothetical protein
MESVDSPPGAEPPADARPLPGGEGPVERHFRQQAPLWLVVGCFAIFSIVYSAPVTYTGSDPHFALLTSQALIQKQTIKLDSYFPKDMGLMQVRAHENGHLYYFFPIGTPLMSTPFVWLANLRGRDMINDAADRDLQQLMASLSVTGIFLLLYFIARRFVSQGYSLLLASGFTLGTSFAGNLGTALWSFNFEVVLLLAAVLLAIRTTAWSGLAKPVFLGWLLVMAYLCRPTAALGVAAILGVVAARSLTAAIKAGIVVAVGVALFFAFSWREYGTLLPPYVALVAGLEPDLFWRAFYATVFGPSRGFLVYAPMLVLTFAGLAVNAPRFIRNWLFWCMSAWVAAQILMIARFHIWWGGWGFGNRLFTDGLVPSFVLTALYMGAVVDAKAPVRIRRVTWVFATLALLGTFINTYQGLYNESTQQWNVPITENLEYVWDWRYPQFLASPTLLAERDLDIKQTLKNRAKRDIAGARAAAHKSPTQENFTRLTQLALKAEDGCTTVWAVGQLKTKWSVPASNVDLATALGQCAANRPELKGPNLLQNGDFSRGIEGWHAHPDADATVTAEARVWHVHYRKGNWQVIYQEQVLRPDTPYLYEATLKTTAPVTALYWQADAGHFAEQIDSAPQWRHVTYAFITPHWDGKALRTFFSPVLMRGAGETWIKDVRLSELSSDIGQSRVSVLPDRLSVFALNDTSQASQGSVNIVGAPAARWRVTVPASAPFEVRPAEGTGPATLHVVPRAVAAPTDAVTEVGINVDGESSPSTRFSVRFKTFASQPSGDPYGAVDSPADPVTIGGEEVPFQGWALDDFDLRRVWAGYEDPSGRMLSVGDARLVGMRPDVAAVKPNAHDIFNDAWILQVPAATLSKIAASRGVLHFFAENGAGRRAEIGRRTVRRR